MVLKNCPRCNGTVLWLDGEPSPSLTIVSDHGTPRVVGCGTCMGRVPAHAHVSPPPIRQNTILGSPPASVHETRPLRQVLAEEGGKVVSLLSEGLDVADRVSKLWDKLKPKKP